jgi:hypothetical protein
MIRWAILFTALLAGPATAQASEARDCRVSEAPPGIRVAERSGCKPRSPDPRQGAIPGRVKAGPAPGFIDLDNGAQVRIGGRADVEVGYRR